MLIDLNKRISVKYNLAFIGTFGLSVQIMYQQGFSKQTEDVCSSNGLSVRVYNRPELTASSLYLNGSDVNSPIEPVIYFYATQADRDKMYNFLKDAMASMNGVHPTGRIRNGDCFYMHNHLIEIHSDDEIVIHGETIKKSVASPFIETLKPGSPVPRFLKFTGNIAA